MSTAASTPKFPSGIGYIVGNEAAERFSYYGMRAILVVFMTKYLMDSTGQMAAMSETEATEWYHNFASATYFFPIIGALISDILWGKYRTIITLSIVYCAGHLCLALIDVPAAIAIMEPRTWLSLGLGLIAMGSGGIKPCVSAHMGDQFTKKNDSLLEKAYSLFYFSINFGSTFSTILTPIFLVKYGPGVAFGIPGILMFIATIVFWMGRHKFIAIPAAGWKVYKEELFSTKGIKAFVNLGILYLFIAVFWSLYDQTGSSWVLQAEKMNRIIDLPFFGATEILSSQIQAINPILVMMYIPLFSILIYPYWGRFTKVTPLKKIGAGFFVTAVSFAICAHIENQIQAGLSPSMWWQIAAYFIITVGEILISITALEFTYTQAPNALKSFFMGYFLLSVSLGNYVTALVNKLIGSGTLNLAGANYYWFFVGMVLITGVLYVFFAKTYKEEKYIQA